MGEIAVQAVVAGVAALRLWEVIHKERVPCPYGWPGDNPTVAPGAGWGWKGDGPSESLHPDLDDAEPKVLTGITKMVTKSGGGYGRTAK